MKFKKNNINFFFGLLLLAIVFSCVPYKRTLLLREEESKYKDTIPTSLNYYKIQFNDVLSINISNFNPQVSEHYNLKNDLGLGGFLVKSNGYVNIPLMDSLYVIGMTVPELEKKVYQLAREQIKEPYVVVRLVNFKIVFLGEVGNPGVVLVKENTINILEGLAMAGGISEMGNNTNIKLVRKISDKESYIVRLDLTKKDLIASPYFYLQPNDILYIEHLKVRTFRTNFQFLVSILGISTFIIVILNFINNNYRR
jgi:polysaccharide export outer membrane protein